MPDPPVGRIGYAIDADLTEIGFRGNESAGTGAREIHCNNCRIWFDHKLGGCPDCGWERPGFSKAIRTGQLNRQLYEQAGLRPVSGDFRA